MKENITDLHLLSEKEYEEMQERLRWLDCLEAAGVDNWSGMKYAMELFTGAVIYKV